MTTLINNTHPIFEADQVLTSGHLNDLFNYLEEQERMTRAKLIGSGIVCGLEVSLETIDGKRSVLISAGVGLSSKGFLVAYDKKDEDSGNLKLKNKNAYAYYKRYEDPISLEDSIKTNDTIYPFFKQGIGQIEMFELHDKNEDGFLLLNEFESEENKPLVNYGVVFYLECFDKELKNCIENDCNEKGVERRFTLRKLLISKEDLRKIIEEESGQAGLNSEADLDGYVNARYYLRPFNVSRLKFTPNDGLSKRQFFLNYQIYLERISQELEVQLTKTMGFLYPILINDVSKKGIFKKFQKSFGLLFKAIVSDSGECHYQYLYGLLNDIAETYNELAEAAFDMISDCCPSLDRFPKHLRLGELREVDSDVPCIPSPYRTGFTQSPIYNHGHQQRGKVLALYNKLNDLLSHFGFDDSQQIKITPSVALNQSLSERAIPYYYKMDKDFLKNWNYERNRKCLSTDNLSYHANKYHTLFDELSESDIPQHVRRPLDYSLNKYDFFRIEGHVCKRFDVALKEILTIRNQQNLPFDVIALKLSRDPRGTTFDDATCNFKDLQILCEAWKSELQCLLGKVIGKLSSVNLKDSIIVDIEENPDSEVLVPKPKETLSKDDLVFGEKPNLGMTMMNPTLGKYTSAADFAKEKTKPRVFNHVAEKISKEEDTVGYMIGKAMTEVNEICKYDVKGTEYMQAQLMMIPGYEFLTVLDNMVAFGHPMSLSVAMLDFSNAMDKDCHDLDMVELEKKLKEMNKRAALYLRDLNSYRNYKFKRVRVDIEAITQLTTVLSTNCSFETLKELQKEMQRRKQEILQMNLFSEYLRKNPGVDHKAGVPKGGTFILLYEDDEKSNVIIEPIKGDSNADSYLVRGVISDVNGDKLIGATLLVKGTNLGTTTDFDGAFQLRVPTGTQSIVISYIGYGSEEVVLNQASFVSVTLGAGESTGKGGTVCADLFVPYLCVSNCPPNVYVFPEKEEVPPEEKVELAITKKSFCKPTDANPHVFIVTPEDGVVTGEGVVGNANDGFAFDANKVDLGTNIFKTITFKVNDVDVPVSVRVEQKPDARFEAETEWKTVGDKANLFPFVLVEIQNYDERFNYKWTITASLGSDKKVLVAEEHIGLKDFPNRQNFQLPQLKPGTPLLIELDASNGKCTDSQELEIEVGDVDIPTDVSFELFLNEKQQVDESEGKHVYSFSSRADGVVAIVARPAGEFARNDASITLGLKHQKGNDENVTNYIFSPFGKPSGAYQLNYVSEFGEKNLNIIIKGFDLPPGFREIAGLRNLGTDPKLVDALGANNIAIRNTETVAKGLSERLVNPALAKTVSSGKFNDDFVKSMLPAMTEVSAKVIAANNPDKPNNNLKQKSMLDLYEKQIAVLLQMITTQDKDVKSNDSLDTMVIQLKKQMNAMKKNGVKINVGKRMQKLFVDAGKSLNEKPKAKKRMNEMIKILKG